MPLSRALSGKMFLGNLFFYFLFIIIISFQLYFNLLLIFLSSFPFSRQVYLFHFKKIEKKKKILFFIKTHCLPELTLKALLVVVVFSNDGLMRASKIIIFFSRSLFVSNTHAPLSFCTQYAHGFLSLSLTIHELAVRILLSLSLSLSLIFFFFFF